MRALSVGPSAATSKRWLSSAEFVVETAATGAEALDLARHYEFDVVVLDLDLAGMNGYEVLHLMRNSRLNVPVLAVSALSLVDAKVRALQLGADDYLTKPFDPTEGLARVQAIIRRSKGFSASVVEVGPLRLDLSAREVAVSGQPVSLTAKEYAIVELLALRKGTTIRKERFLNHLYGGIDEPEIKIIDVFVCKIRRKLADAGCGNLIHTAWGQGYTLREPTEIPLAVPESGWTQVERLAA